MILVTGAGGKTGKALIKALSKAESVSAFVYHEEQVAVAKSLGAERVVVGDLRDEEVIRQAMHGIRAVYHVCPNMSPDELVISQFVIDAARKNKVEHFVYHSVLHPQTEKMTHHWQKLHVEEMIFESGLPFTIVQPAPYMQNLLAGWETIVRDGIIRVPYSVDSKFSFVDLEDVAEAAKIILTEPYHFQAIYELAGTSAMSHVDAAERFGRVLKRSIRAEKEEIGTWKQQAGEMSDYALENLVSMFEYYDRWGLAGNPNVLMWLLKRPPTSWETSIQRIATE
jgi:uncharacterized protein YbjT (DUF2867 family)